MPLTKLPAGANYRANGQFMAFFANMGIELGIKIHVSATCDNSKIISRTVLPILCNIGVSHKVFAYDDHISNGQAQTKKFITVYPQSGSSLDSILERLDSALCNVQRRQLDQGVDVIPGDLPYGHSGYVFTRYGNFLKDDPSDNREVVSPRIFDHFLHGINVFVPSEMSARDSGIDRSDWVDA